MANPATEERRLGLLRRIADAGGRITPEADPHADHGYRYPNITSGDAERDLPMLARHDYLDARFFERVALCPKCTSHYLNVREICPGCRRAHLVKEGLLHHFRCGYSGLSSEFKLAEDGSYLCPKCNRIMRYLGTEYDRFSRAFVCRECGLVTENPPVEALCFACGARASADDLVSINVFSYVLTSLGAAALRRGSFLGGDDENAFIPGAPVYPRNITLELLRHEMKRLASFNSRFSVLLIEHARPSAGDHDRRSPPWLAQLRRCLREVDLLGELSEGLLLVILPQTRRRTAETLSRQIAAAIGQEALLSCSAAEISGPDDLAAVLGRRSVHFESA